MFSLHRFLLATAITLQCILAVSGQELCRDHNLSNGTHPHPTSCNLYLICHEFSTTIVQCPAGQTYDPIRNRCWDANTAAPCNDFKVRTVAPDNAQCTTTAKGDILFILDSSSSIGIRNYTIQLQFVAGLTKSFTLGNDQVQFGMIVFASFAESVFKFGQYQNHTALEQAILSSQYVAAGTNTYYALEFARTTAFSPSYGARPDVAHLAIVLTDGLSSDTSKTQHEAELLRGTGVHVLAIGVGNFNRNELDAVASSLNDVFLVGSYDVLNTIEKDLTTRTCNEVIHTICKNFTMADVIFVLDSSGSIGAPDFYKQLMFTANLTKNFRLGIDEVRFAALIFGSDVQKLFDLGTYSDHGSLERAILAANYMSTGTDTAAALTYIIDHNMFASAAGGRESAAKIVMVLTDGRSNSPSETIKAAVRIKERGIQMMSIGVGNSVDQQELVVLASSHLNIFLASSYDVLHRLQDEVTNRTCEIPSEVIQDMMNVCREQNWENGIHAHPFDCTKFIECTFLHTDIMHCPPNLVFDPLKETCLMEQEALSCHDYNNYKPFPGYTTQRPQTTSIVDISGVCRENNWASGIHPHPTDCSYYLQCNNYVTTATRCPDFKVFDPISKSCKDPAVAAPCNDHITSAHGSTTIGLAPTTTSLHYDMTNVCLQFLLVNGIYPDPGSCRHFVECVATITYHLVCPEGLQFNSKKLVCDDVHNIDCNDNFNFAFENVAAG